MYISANFNLRSDIESRITNASTVSEEFFFFIADHIELIRSSADQMYPTELFKYDYRNDIVKYFKDSGCKEEHIWIALMINRMTTIDTVLDKKVIYIPSVDVIAKLIDKYNNLKNMRAQSA